MWNFLEGFLEDSDMPAQGALAVYVGRRANLICDSLKWNFFAAQAAFTVIKMMHAGNYSRKGKTGAGSKG